jgi:hypothetical protein
MYSSMKQSEKQSRSMSPKYNHVDLLDTEPRHICEGVCSVDVFLKASKFYCRSSDPIGTELER